MILLDTNICVYLIRRRSEAVLGRLAEATERGERIAVSVITAFELEVGAQRAQGRRYSDAVRRFLAEVEVCPLDDAARAGYARLRTALERRGETIGPLDMLIAAHAVALKATLVTNNEREFRRVAGLRVENWAG
jgi:tRNA(fMet)-specific endonuclease VapC